MSFVRFAMAGAAMLALTACNAETAPEPEAEQTEIPEEIADESREPPEVREGLGTPLEERVATLGLINKRNNISRDIELKPGESRRLGDVIVRLASCEKSAPWENPPQTGAFVQVMVQEREDAGSDPQWRRVFSGWLFKESPSVNVVEHPIYDVWVKECAMSFPGEEADSPAPDSPAAG